MIHIKENMFLLLQKSTFTLTTPPQITATVHT